MAWTWFSEGLTKEELTKEYRKLALKYHPDICKDGDAEEKMKEINEEYDIYYTVAHSASIGYSASDIKTVYEQARKERSVILAFLKRDKKSGGGWFMFNKHGKIRSVGPSWDKFRGGFALCRLTQTMSKTSSWSLDVEDQEVERIPASIECPSYADMYFGSLYGEFESESTQLATVEQGEKASLDTDYLYDLVRTSQYGEVWTRVEVTCGRRGWKPITYAYMMVNGRLMQTPFSLNRDYMTVIESVPGRDFGYLVFQNCTEKAFAETHDVDYEPALAQAVDCKRLVGGADLLWIHDPVVSHYARMGIVNFYCSRRNFRLRYGTFSGSALRERLHDIGIEEAEIIQDFLDELNGDFDAKTRGMAKKGKISLRV